MLATSLTEPTAKCVRQTARPALTPTLATSVKTVISKPAVVIAWLVLQIVNTAVQQQCAVSAIPISISRTVFAQDAKMRAGLSKASIVWRAASIITLNVSYVMEDTVFSASPISLSMILTERYVEKKRWRENGACYKCDENCGKCSGKTTCFACNIGYFVRNVKLVWAAVNTASTRKHV